VTLATLAGLGLAALPFSLHWYNVQALGDAVRHGPSITPAVPLGAYRAQLDRGRAGELIQSLAGLAHRTSSFLGHDDLGRSLLFRLWPGVLVSLLIGGASALIAVVIGGVWGGVAGLSGGRIDAVMMRIVDVLFALPYILMVILLKTAVAGPMTAVFAGAPAGDVVLLIVAIGGVSWLTMARVVRGQVLSLKAQPFVEAARAAGAGPTRILVRHIAPHLVGPVTVYATLVVPQAILQESFLSYLGIGIRQPLPSLGRLAADGVQAVNTFVSFWWLLVVPCTALVVTLLALNFIGDGLREAFDPKAQPAQGV
jgi:oligopeptide transport system permease protein